ncbi:SNQ2_6 [Sanghuangporus weigelae]
MSSRPNGRLRLVRIVGDLVHYFFAQCQQCRLGIASNPYKNGHPSSTCPAVDLRLSPQEQQRMHPSPSEAPPDEERDDPDYYGVQRPGRARTVLDMKDRVPVSFEPFITFDFEPETDAISSWSHNDPRSSGQRVSRVAIDHFDPEGVEHLRSRFSQTSEYSAYLPENRNDKAPKRKQKRKRGKKSGSNLPSPPLSEESRVVRTKRVAKSSTSEVSILEIDTYTDKHLVPFNLEAALRETIKRHGSSDTSSLNFGLGFRDLCVFGADRSLSSGTVYQTTLCSILNPIEWSRQLLRLRKRAPRRLMSGFEGVVSSGEMLLVLGRPGSGCSTFLKTLANQTKEFVHVLGERQYGSLTPRDITSSFRNRVWYCPESATDVPTLTVLQMIFSAARARNHDCCLSPADIEQLSDALAAIFGLRHVKNLLMEDSKVTRSERRRVSICEALAARALFVQALRIATDLSSMTTIVTLSQGGEALYQLFDKVCVIGEGRMLYYGKADAARQHFIDLGYDPLPRQTTSDFLISVTDPLGRIQNPGRPFSAPRTAEEFARAFHRSPLGRANRLEVTNYWQKNSSRTRNSELGNVPPPKAESSKLIRRTISSWIHQLSVAITRKCSMVRNSWISVMMQIFLPVFQGAITGLAYWHTPGSTTAFVLRDGLIFIIMLFSSLSAMVESLEIDSYAFRAIRQRHAELYRRLPEAVATTLLDILITLLSQAGLSASIYILAGFQGSVMHFLVFLLFVVSTAIAMKALFRSVAILTKTTGYSLAGSVIILFLLFSGFNDLPSSVKRVSLWLSWLDPLRYAFEGLIVNEYHGVQVPCSDYASGGEIYGTATLQAQICLSAALASEQINISGHDYFEDTYGYSYANLWTIQNFAFIAAFATTFSGFYLIISEWSSPGYTRLFTYFETGTLNQGSTNGLSDPYRHIRRTHQAIDVGSGEQYEIPLNDVFAWKNLQYAVSQRNEQKVLLDGISGYVAPRKLCALVGQHGVGKTTLLKVLASRHEEGDVSGDMHLNGTLLPSDFRSQVGFCQQADVHYPKQTVCEALRFSAELRQPTTVSRREKRTYVDSCLKMCGLEAYADAMVCTLNLENQRRTSIGIELAAQPRLLLFLDEPTSGLDPQEALGIVALLRDLANHGQAILCSMHQPSSEILDHFDQLLVLHKGGKMVYFGDIGNDCEIMIDYFERNGAQLCSASKNPVEWMMNLISSDDHAYIPIDWPGKWLRSPEIGMLRRDIDEFQRKSHRSIAKSTPYSSTSSGMNWFHQAYTLSKRTFVAYWRSPEYLLAKLMINLLSGIFIGFAFYQSDNSLHGLQRKVFAAFMLTIISVPISCQLQATFIDARQVYELQERHSRMYSWSAFLATHLLVELFWNIISSVLFFSAWYWVTGFPTNRVVYSFLIIGFFYPLFYTTQALAVTSFSSSTKISSLLLCISFSFTGIFDGITHTSEHSKWQEWLYGSSPLTYLLEGFIGQALGQQLAECSQNEFLQLIPPSGQTCVDYLNDFIDEVGGYLNNPHGSEICEYCPARTTDEYLASRYNIYYSHRWRNMMIVLAACLLNIVLMFVLTYIFRIRRGRLFRSGSKTKA